MIQLYPIRVIRGRFINYTYLLFNNISNEAVVIDPGYEFDTLVTQIKNAGVQLRAILLTHHHEDHTQSAGQLAVFFNVPVWINELEQRFYGFTCSNLQTFYADSTLTIGSFHIPALHTPGHTKGSVCFYIDKYLFTGDTLFIEGCGMCLGKGADPLDMFNSIQKIRVNTYMTTLVYPGHCFGIEPGLQFEKVLNENIYFHINRIDKFVNFRMRKNQKGWFDFK
jgi:hydroxyacylglutathione hydrolase